MSASRIKIPPYPEDYPGHVRKTPEECQFGDGLLADDWDDRMHGFEYGMGNFVSLLFDPYLQYPKDQPPPYADYMFKGEDRMQNGERKEFYIRIDPGWVDAVLDAELECENEPAPVEFQLKGMNWFANIRWSDEHKGYVARVPALYRCAVLGDSIEDAKAKIQKAAEEWQESELDKWERPEARPIMG